MRIGAVAAEAGVGVETVRFYERRGLIEQPARPAGGGFRRYDAGASARIRFIRQAQALGFSLSEIEELMSLRADPNVDCADMAARARAKLDEVELKIERLAAMGDALRTLLNACPGNGPAARRCSILNALEPDEMRKEQSDDHPTNL